MPPSRGRATRGAKASGSGRGFNSSTRRPPSDPAPPRPLTAEPLIPSTKSIGKLIIGIDIGTTQCAVATAEVLYNKQKGNTAQAEPNIKLYEGWVGFYMNRISTPRTALYYKEDGSPVTGNHLQRLFDDANPNTLRPERLIRLWKLMFHHHQDEPIILNIQAQIRSQLAAMGKDEDDLMKDWARLLLDHLFQDTIASLARIYENFPKLDVEIVIAVPPGRSEIAHDKVIQAFVQGPISSSAVSLESEPAALFRNWVYEGENSQNWVVGNRYLVADGGGGTACFVRFKLVSLKPLKFVPEHPPKSIVCGAEMISDLFERLISTKVPQDIKNRSWNIGRIRNMFDIQHKLYVSLEDQDISFQKPWARSDEDMMIVTVDEIKDCFSPCIRMLSAGIKEQLALGEPVDYLVLGGGLFQNRHVRDAIKESFKNLIVLETSKYKGAVARSAILSRIYDNFISREEFKRTKANVTLLEVTNKLKKTKLFKRLHLKKRDCDSKTYFWAATYLVKQGDKSRNSEHIFSEDNAKDARLRYVDDDNFQFSERILTFNYRPGKDTWAAYTKDGTWISQEGKEIPQPEQQELITWNPLTNETMVDLDDLDRGKDKAGMPYKILRYSVLLQATSISTKYWAQCWASNAMKRKFPDMTFWSLSQPVERKALFEAQAISQSLADGFGLEEATAKLDSTRSGHQVVSAPADTGPDSDEAGPSQSDRMHSSRHQLSPQSIVPANTNGNSQRLSLASPSRFPSKALQKALVSGAEYMSSTRTPQHFLGQPDKATPQSTSSRRGAVMEGALRDNGSCWTCRLRHTNCGNEKPKCKKCATYGIECNYCQPAWWGDDEICQERLERYKDKIKQHSAKASPYQSMASTTAKEPQNRVQSGSGLQNRYSPSLQGPLPKASSSRLETNKRPGDQTTAGPQAKRTKPPLGLTPVKHGSSLPNSRKSYGTTSRLQAAKTNAHEDSDEDMDNEVYRKPSSQLRLDDSDSDELLK